ncbi:MAG TPA: BrnA antitoxin family protein [Saliniramus sp.]|nr:BrnA antitoxin family protein [Saliniramus sp.]
MRKPISHRGADPRQAAEAAFKAATSKPVEAEVKQKPRALPAAKELVPLRIDRDVLEHFQNEGPGWQERINQALRQAAGLDETAEK